MVTSSFLCPSVLHPFDLLSNCFRVPLFSNSGIYSHYSFTSLLPALHSNRQHDELSSTHAASTKQLSELQLTLTAATDATKKEEEEKQQLVAVAKQELEKYELLQKQHVDLQTTHGASVKSASRSRMNAYTLQTARERGRVWVEGRC